MRPWVRRRHARSVGRGSLHAQQALILALDVDVNRQLNAAEAASTGITTRASILIAAAGLTSGLQLSSQLIVSAILTVVAALVGVGLLIMRTANELPILEAEETFWTDAPAVAQRNILHWKHDVLREREKSLHRRRIVLIVGFALVAVSISWELVVELLKLVSGGGE